MALVTLQSLTQGILSMALEMTWQARKDKASEMIAFLSAFDICHTDAQNILANAYQSIIHMTPEEYNSSGQQMATFASMVQQATKR